MEELLMTRIIIYRYYKGSKKAETNRLSLTETQ